MGDNEQAVGSHQGALGREAGEHHRGAEAGEAGVMRAIVALAVLAATVAASPSTLPRRLNCVQIGVWGCNPEPDGICIDGHRERGGRYTFDTRRMTFKSPHGRGRITSISQGDRGTLIVRLSNATEFATIPATLQDGGILP